MPRSVPEWIGTTPDTAIPARVKMRLRVFTFECPVCRRPDYLWRDTDSQVDHIVALVNGGENRENNLQIICGSCHKAKTATDVAEKAVVARKRKKALGIKAKPKRPLMGTVASGWRRRMDGTVERRKKT